MTNLCQTCADIECEEMQEFDFEECLYYQPLGINKKRLAMVGLIPGKKSNKARFTKLVCCDSSGKEFLFRINGSLKTNVESGLLLKR